MELSIEVLGLLMLVGLVAGIVDAIAGGGGLITVPALLLAGLDPVAAVATNKLQGTFGTFSSTYAFWRAGRISWAAAQVLVPITLVAAMAGAFAIRAVPVDVLRMVMPVLLIGIAIYFAVSPRMSDEDARQRLGLLPFGLLVCVPVGFYDGVFGPGAGSFFMLGAVLLLGQGLLRATAQTKLLNATSNFGALIVFVAAGSVVWLPGLAMAATQILGGQIGARLAMRVGARLIRPLLVVVCVGMALRLLAVHFTPS